MKAGTRLLFAGSVAALSLAAPAARADDGCEGRAGDGAVKLTVATTGVRAAKGEVAVTVYPDNPIRFLAPHGKLLRARVTTTALVTRVCFWLPPATYAVAVYHDQNGDRDFNRDVLGRPMEGYGFSNDAPTRFNLPAFDAVRFRLPAAGRTLSVRMRYPQ